MKTKMPKLKRLAEKLNCYVEETEHTICVIAKDGYSWEDGMRGWTNGHYGPSAMPPEYVAAAQGVNLLAAYRQRVIEELIEELTEYPPVNTPYDEYGDAPE